MSMTKPPCYNGGDDCPRRYVGCRAGCKEWHDWLALHAEEKERIRSNKARELDADGFLVESGKRKRDAKKADYQKRRRKGRTGGR